MKLTANDENEMALTLYALFEQIRADPRYKTLDQARDYLVGLIDNTIDEIEIEEKASEP